MAKKAKGGGKLAVPKKLTITKARKMGFTTAAAIAAAATKTVTFTCSSSACVASLQAGLLKATFVGTGKMVMPVGTYPMTYQVKGNNIPFTVTATNAKMTTLAGTATTSGVVMIAV